MHRSFFRKIKFIGNRWPLVRIQKIQVFKKKKQINSICLHNHVVNKYVGLDLFFTRLNNTADSKEKLSYIKFLLKITKEDDTCGDLFFSNKNYVRMILYILNEKMIMMKGKEPKDMSDYEIVNKIFQIFLTLSYHKNFYQIVLNQYTYKNMKFCLFYIIMNMLNGRKNSDKYLDANAIFNYFWSYFKSYEEDTKSNYIDDSDLWETQYGMINTDIKNDNETKININKELDEMKRNISSSGKSILLKLKEYKMYTEQSKKGNNTLKIIEKTDQVKEEKEESNIIEKKKNKTGQEKQRDHFETGNIISKIEIGSKELPKEKKQVLKVQEGKTDQKNKEVTQTRGTFQENVLFIPFYFNENCKDHMLTSILLNFKDHKNIVVYKKKQKKDRKQKNKKMNSSLREIWRDELIDTVGRTLNCNNYFDIYEYYAEDDTDILKFDKKDFYYTLNVQEEEGKEKEKMDETIRNITKEELNIMEKTKEQESKELKKDELKKEIEQEEEHMHMIIESMENVKEGKEKKDISKSTDTLTNQMNLMQMGFVIFKKIKPEDIKETKVENKNKIGGETIIEKKTPFSKQPALSATKLKTQIYNYVYKKKHKEQEYIYEELYSNVKDKNNIEEAFILEGIIQFNLDLLKDYKISDQEYKIKNNRNKEMNPYLNLILIKNYVELLFDQLNINEYVTNKLLKTLYEILLENKNVIIYNLFCQNILKRETMNQVISILDKSVTNNINKSNSTLLLRIFYILSVQPSHYSYSNEIKQQMKKEKRVLLFMNIAHYVEDIKKDSLVKELQTKDSFIICLKRISKFYEAKYTHQNNVYIPDESKDQFLYDHNIYGKKLNNIYNRHFICEYKDLIIIRKTNILLKVLGINMADMYNDIIHTTREKKPHEYLIKVNDLKTNLVWGMKNAINRGIELIKKNRIFSFTYVKFAFSKWTKNYKLVYLVKAKQVKKEKEEEKRETNIPRQQQKQQQQQQQQQMLISEKKNNKSIGTPLYHVNTKEYINTVKFKEIIRTLKKKKKRKIRILCLDGGGMRGLLSIEILKYINSHLKKNLFEYFDIICGTSTGAVISILVGLEKAHLNEVEYLYNLLISKIFQKDTYAVRNTRYLLRQSYYDSNVINNILDSFFKNMKMYHYNADFFTPYVFTISTQMNVSPAQPVILKNYGINWDSLRKAKKTEREKEKETKEDMVHRQVDETYTENNFKNINVYTGYHDIFVKYVLRCSTAAPGFFNLFSFDNFNIYADGALSFNNPTLISLNELQMIFYNCLNRKKNTKGVFERIRSVFLQKKTKEEEEEEEEEEKEKEININEYVDCIVSVGTGKYIPELLNESNETQSSDAFLRWDVILKQIVYTITNTESTHDICNTFVQHNKYFRFNCFINSIRLDETSPDIINKLKQIGKRYFEDHPKNQQLLLRLIRILEQEEEIKEYEKRQKKLWKHSVTNSLKKKLLKIFTSNQKVKPMEEKHVTTYVAKNDMDKDKSKKKDPKKNEQKTNEEEKKNKKKTYSEFTFNLMNKEEKPNLSNNIEHVLDLINNDNKYFKENNPSGLLQFISNRFYQNNKFIKKLENMQRNYMFVKLKNLKHNYVNVIPNTPIRVLLNEIYFILLKKNLYFHIEDDSYSIEEKQNETNDEININQIIQNTERGENRINKTTGTIEINKRDTEMNSQDPKVRKQTNVQNLKIDKQTDETKSMKKLNKEKESRKDEEENGKNKKKQANSFSDDTSKNINKKEGNESKQTHNIMYSETCSEDQRNDKNMNKKENLNNEFFKNSYFTRPDSKSKTISLQYVFNLFFKKVP